MKTAIALLVLSITTSAFSCTDLIGDYVCIDQYSYSYYRNFSIKEEGTGLVISENGRNRYGRVLRTDEKMMIEDLRVKVKCNKTSIKVIAKLGSLSATDTYKKMKKGMEFSANEEGSHKRLKCERQ